MSLLRIIQLLARHIEKYRHVSAPASNCFSLYIRFRKNEMFSRFFFWPMLIVRFHLAGTDAIYFSQPSNIPLKEWFGATPSNLWHSCAFFFSRKYSLFGSRPAISRMYRHRRQRWRRQQQHPGVGNAEREKNNFISVRYRSVGINSNIARFKEHPSKGEKKAVMWMLHRYIISSGCPTKCCRAHIFPNHFCGSIHHPPPNVYICFAFFASTNTSAHTHTHIHFEISRSAKCYVDVR